LHNLLLVIEGIQYLVEVDVCHGSV